MKRIEFIAPVEAMRGNLSGSQKLTYPTKDNTAWDAPTGKQSGATNYQPRYIGSKSALTGRKGFSVRTRNTINISPALRKNMALLGSQSVIANYALQNLGILDALQAAFLKYRPEGWSMKRWVSSKIRIGIELLNNSFTFDESGAPTVLINNPFTVGVDDRAVFSGIPDKDFFKFWPLLGRSGSVVVELPVSDQQLPVYATFVNGIQFNSQFPEVNSVVFQFVRPRNQSVYRNGRREKYFDYFQAKGSDPAAATVRIGTSDLTHLWYDLMKRPKGDTETAWTAVDWTDTCDTTQYDYMLQYEA